MRRELSGTRRITLAALGAVLALAALLAPATPAGAAGAHHHQRFLIAGTVQDPTALVFADGVVHGRGALTATSADFHRETGSYVETDLLAVGSGSLQVVIHGAFSTWPFTLDAVTCTQRGRVSGTWSIVSGDGSLAGATGGGTLSGVFFTYAGRTAGGCDETAIKGFVLGPMVGTLDRPRPPAD